MAGKGWGSDTPLESLLFEEGYRFEFFQAVRLLTRLNPDRSPIGHDGSPSREVVRFGAHPSLSFPPSAIHEIVRTGDGAPRMTLAFIGLIGPQGVLPRHYTELVLERIRKKDFVLKDFLDLLGHRFISFFYKAWERAHFPFAYERVRLSRQGRDYFSQHLFDLMGVGTRGLQDRMALPDEHLLFYAGILCQRPASAHGLETLLQDYLSAPVHVVQFVGQWLNLPTEESTGLSSRNSNNALGIDAVIGSQVWDQQAKFRLQIGPLRLREFNRLLPSGHSFASIVQFARFYTGERTDFDIQLLLKASHVPDWMLGRMDAEAPRLGWSTWLKTREFACDAADTIITDCVSRDELLQRKARAEARRAAA